MGSADIPWSRVDALVPAQRKVIADAAALIEADSAAFEAAANTADIERQKQAGIQTIELKGGDGEAYLAKAYEAGWAGIIKQSPEHGPKLREFFAKPK